MRRRIAFVVTIASLLALAPAASSEASPGTFVFYGSGYGHGVGMSQWGAYGLAKKGWTHQDILTHYYTGTTVAHVTNEPATIRVGLVDSIQAAHLTAKRGPVAIRVGSPAKSTTVAATIPPGKTYLVKGGSGKFVIVDDTGAPVGQPIDGAGKLFVTYRDANAMVSSPEAGHTYNRGWIEMDDYAPCGSCDSRLRMIAIVSPQEYLYGLGEVPSSWPAEAMESQAVAGRTYAEFLINVLGQHRSGCNCGVYDDTRNQVYAGWDHEGEDQGERWVQAVDDTAGEVVLYNGKLIEAQYTSSSGGYTENNENVWGGAPIPYLRGVCDPGDYTPANPAKAWRVSMTADQVTSRLRSYTGDIGTVKRFAKIRRGVSGRILSATVVGSTGSGSVAGSTIRGALGLLDDRVWINRNKNVTGAIRAKYDSLDCSPGLPSSTEVPVDGGSVQRFSDGAIWRNTQAGRAMWLRGPIEDEYVTVKEAGGVLGLPLSGVITLSAPAKCTTQKCAKARFENGWIFFKAGTGAHEVHGAIGDYYLSQKGATGHLGFPTSDVSPDGSGGTEATFEGNAGSGAILVTCAKDGTCKESPVGSRRP